MMELLSEPSAAAAEPIDDSADAASSSDEKAKTSKS